MRIWIANHYASPPTYPGGTRHYNFAKRLINRGNEVVLIAANYNHFSHEFVYRGPLGKIDSSSDVPFIWIPTAPYKGNTISRFYNMLSYGIKMTRKKYLPIAEKPDIIIGSSPHLFAALGALLLAKRLNVPFILEIRDLWPESLVDLGHISRYHPLILLMKTIERYLYKEADRIISLLPAVDTYLSRYGIDPKKILWLPNSVDLDSINVETQPISKKFTVMYAGAHGLANDLETVIHAAAIIEKKYPANNITICLIGEGPEKSKLKKLAEEHNVSIVEFHDAVPKAQIYHVLNQADACLMLLKDSPVFRFGISPNKLFDYLVMSKPIIYGVKTPYNPIEKARAGLSINPSDPEALADAIHSLFTLPCEERQAMGLRGKQYVMDHYHIDKLTDSLENFVQSVLV